MQHDGIVDLRTGEQYELGLQCGEQSGLIVLVKNLARMLVEGDNCRLHAAVLCLRHHLVDEIPVATVHAVKEAYGSYQRLR